MPSYWSREKYYQASLFAAKALNKVTFPCTDYPFIWHLSLVSIEVIAVLQAESGHDGDLALQCALLHDAIDYSDITIEDLKKEFGIRVADGVQALCRPSGVPEPQKLLASLSRIRQQPPEIWIVKMADKTTNLASPPKGWTGHILEAYKRDSLQTLESLKPASPFMAERLLTQIHASRL
jgi:(p)ppGpp synthase/HD superfamily hydrolase